MGSRLQNDRCPRSQPRYPHLDALVDEHIRRRNADAHRTRRRRHHGGCSCERRRDNQDTDTPHDVIIAAARFSSHRKAPEVLAKVADGYLPIPYDVKKQPVQTRLRGVP
jgi:hypothetical protein